MGAYNVAPYIGAAIESVIAQTEADWELLIVDDGSTDRTADIVRDYARADSRLRLLTQTNGGISSARNRALRASTGAFLAILDSDDLWDPRYLASQLALFEQHPDVDIVTGNGWFLGGVRHGAPARPFPDARPQPTLANILADDEAIFIMSIMRRRVYETIGEFNERLRTNEDYEFWLRAAAAGFRFLRNDEPLGHYRRRGDSLSANDLRMLTGILVVYESMRPLLDEGRPERDILERQIARFERDHHTVSARRALEAGNAAAASFHLTQLSLQGGGLRITLASWLARWTPGLLVRAYGFRRLRQTPP